MGHSSLSCTIGQHGELPSYFISWVCWKVPFSDLHHFLSSKSWRKCAVLHLFAIPLNHGPRVVKPKWCWWQCAFNSNPAVTQTWCALLRLKWLLNWWSTLSGPRIMWRRPLATWPPAGMGMPIQGHPAPCNMWFDKIKVLFLVVPATHHWVIASSD